MTQKLRAAVSLGAVFLIILGVAHAVHDALSEDVEPYLDGFYHSGSARSSDASIFSAHRQITRSSGPASVMAWSLFSNCSVASSAPAQLRTLLARFKIP